MTHETDNEGVEDDTCNVRDCTGQTNQFNSKPSLVQGVTARVAGKRTELENGDSNELSCYRFFLVAHVHRSLVEGLSRRFEVAVHRERAVCGA